jgi:hypothetical protein
MSGVMPPRVVPTLTEVLDEASIRPAAENPAAADLPADGPAEPAFDSFAEPAPLPVPADDFELDLGLAAATVPAPVPAQEPAADPSAPSFYDALELGLRQRASLALDVALDGWLQQTLRERLEQAAARQTESLLQELREMLAPQLEALVQQTLGELLRQERDRLSSR